MKNFTLFIILSFVLMSCQQKYAPQNYNRSTLFHNKRVAVMPFDIYTSVEHLPKGATIAMVEKAERKKARVMQRDLYRYILRELAKSSRKVKLQSLNKTIKLINESGYTDEEIIDLPKRKLAKILKVDIIVQGSLYQYKNKMRWEGDDFLRYTGSNNRVSTVINVYEKKRGRIEWKYDKSQSGFPSDYAPDAIKGLLRKAARNFPL